MSLAMTEAERDAFLAGVHVGIIAIEQPDAPPLAVPIWYDYAPDKGVWVISGDTSLKARLIAAAGRYSLAAQDETPPAYRYVSVEGPVVETRAADVEADLRPMAHRYFGAKTGDAYVAAAGGSPMTLFLMRPETWRTVDYHKSELADLP